MSTTYYPAMTYQMVSLEPPLRPPSAVGDVDLVAVAKVAGVLYLAGILLTGSIVLGRRRRTHARRMAAARAPGFYEKTSSTDIDGRPIEVWLEPGRRRRPSRRRRTTRRRRTR